MAEYTITPVVFQGGRELTTKEIFYERKFYKDVVRQIFINYSVPVFHTFHKPSGNPNYIDLWYDTPFYGKITPFGELYIPDDARISFGGGQNLASFPFVHDAFNDFRSYVQRASNLGKADLAELFGDFGPKKSYENPKISYFRFALKFMEGFNGYLKMSKNSATNLQEYKDEFIKFYSKYGPHDKVPLSFSNFFAASGTTINATALAIELAVVNHTEDFPKNRIFESASFYKYIQAAANFGFRINKNAPWSLIADLKSKPMRTYFNKHGIHDVNSLFYGYQTSGGHYGTPSFLLEKDLTDAQLEELKNPHVQLPYYKSASLYEFAALGAVLFEGYSRYRKNMMYEVKTSFCINSGTNFKSRDEISVYNRTQKIVNIEKISEKQFFENYVVDASILYFIEKMKRFESKKRNHIKYEIFRKKLDYIINTKSTQSALSQGLMLIGNYYNPTKIFKTRNSALPHYFEINQKGSNNDLTGLAASAIIDATNMNNSDTY